jgi:CBS domain-containing protein
MVRRLIAEVIGNQQLLTLPRTASVRDAARAMRERHVGSVLIAAADRLEGIFTERDMVFRVVAEGRDPDATALADVMTADPDVLPPQASALDALRRMQDGGYRHLPIIESGRIVGIVSRGDFRGLELDRLDEETGLWERL